MTGPVVGIDISADQPSVPAGDWLFIVHKATEGLDYVDPDFKARFPTLNGNGLRGAYHYARPTDAYSGVQQAEYFAVAVLSSGFRPGVDLWQLDCEATGNESVGDAGWTLFVNDFMHHATQMLGNRGFLYVGAYFSIGAFTELVRQYNWWLPDYGVNDGEVNPFAGTLVATPMLHQYTDCAWGSFGPLDRNVVNNEQAWAFMFPPPPPVVKPTPAIIAALKRIAALAAVVRHKPIRRGDKGPNVSFVQSLLRQRGFPFVQETGVYDDNTALAVALFKRSVRLSNLNGDVCGRACINALLK
jgi:GH25 family lysozyme M1 (1,4-beta-N-acetylmuramidase)